MCPSFEQLPPITQPHLAQLHLLEEQSCSAEEPINPAPEYLVQKVWTFIFFSEQPSPGDNSSPSVSLSES